MTVAIGERRVVPALPTRRSRTSLPTLPPLQNGDCLTRAEFEQRYAMMPHIKNAELIEGVVYMAAAVRFGSHGKPHGQILWWLMQYCTETPYVESADNTTVRLDEENEVQPDALLRIDAEAGGQSRISDDDYVEGAPELIVEIAYSSAAYDLHQKLNVYRRNQVQEYVVWQAHDQRLDWWSWQAGEYVPLRPDADGIIRSRIFPGLHLAVNALLAGKLADVLAVLQQGLHTEEHVAFVRSLEGKAV